MMNGSPPDINRESSAQCLPSSDARLSEFPLAEASSAAVSAASFLNLNA
jgi:hypothetical protein